MEELALMVQMVTTMVRCRHRVGVITSRLGMEVWIRRVARGIRSAENSEKRKVEGAFTL